MMLLRELKKRDLKMSDYKQRKTLRIGPKLRKAQGRNVNERRKLKKKLD